MHTFLLIQVSLPLTSQDILCCSSHLRNPVGTVAIVQIDSHPQNADAQETHRMMMRAASLLSWWDCDSGGKG